MLKIFGYLLLISLVLNLQSASCDPVGNFFQSILGILGLNSNKGNPTYRLNYFNARARGEVIRWIFKASNKEFEDFRIQGEDWAALKKTYPFGQLPVLDIIDTNAPLIRIAQSGTIARLLAKRFGLAGKTELETVYTEMYADQVNDLFNKMSTAISDNTTQLPFFNRTVIENFNFFEDRLTTNNGYLSGSQLTYPDLYLSSITDMLGKAKEDLLKPFPRIAALDNKVRNIPGIKDWIAKRPKTDF